MRHGIAGRKFNRDMSARKAMFASLTNALLKHGQIKTTLPKAKDLRRVVEPLITKAKEDTVSNRRLVARTITDKDIVKHLFENIAPVMKDRPGGYVRVLKAGFRTGDAAPMAVISLTEEPKKPFGAEATEETAKKASKPAAKKEAKAKAEDKPAKKAAAKKAPAKKAAKKTETKAEDK